MYFFCTIPLDEQDSLEEIDNQYKQRFHKKIRSSANNIFETLKLQKISLMRSKNNKGPETEPCGIPDVSMKFIDLYSKH